MRDLVLATYRANKAARNPSIILHLECYFAIGTLTGVCLAWTCTDVLLGFRAHFLHSLGTLVAALVWCKCIISCFAPEEEEIQDAKVPLLKEASSFTESDNDSMAALVHCSRFKLSSLFLGLITGFFIQFSSLGANFALSHFVLPNSPSTATIAVFSLIWSFVTSGMGTFVLTLARGMLIFTYSMDRSPRSDDEEIMEPSLLRMECFFAVGALLGVNLAWMGTDLLMGLKVQYLPAFITESVVILAVWLTLRYTASRPPSSPNTVKKVCEEP
jgi:hypothetical protein